SPWRTPMQSHLNIPRAGTLSPFLAIAIVTLSLIAAPIEALAQNPVPSVNQPLVPASAAPGGPGFSLAVTGSGFVPTSVVSWNGSARSTNFVSTGKLTAAITAQDVASPGTAWI